MRAVICRELTGVGGLEYVDNWPEPQAGPGEVLVDVKAAALNFPDLLMIQGLYQERPPLPFVVGTEMSGVVSARKWPSRSWRLPSGISRAINPEWSLRARRWARLCFSWLTGRRTGTQALQPSQCGR